MKIEPNQTWTAVTYPQDFSEGGKRLGPQTILRLKRIVSVVREERYSIGTIVLACGIGPDRKEYPYQSLTFSDMMKDWLVTEGTFPPDSIHSSPNREVWNCIEVTLEIVHCIREKNFSKNVLVVSTGGHIYPRMWTTWKLLCAGKNGWNVACVPVWEGTSGVFHELAGTVKYIPMALWHRKSM